MLKKVRIDKWLWSVRIFKTRTLATNSCKSGKVKIDGENVKPSYLVQRDEIVQVRKEGFDLQFKVIDLIEKRVGAPIAQKCYENQTSEEELNKYKDWFVGKGRPEVREKGAGRPTKKDRRQIEEFKDWED
ncbi:MAG: RNA-binding S4 domain-containing protein [Bacteroidota bacterium]